MSTSTKSPAVLCGGRFALNAAFVLKTVVSVVWGVGHATVYVFEPVKVTGVNVDR